MKLQSKSSPLSPTWDVLVENNKDMKTTPQSKPIQVTKKTQVYRKRGGEKKPQNTTTARNSEGNEGPKKRSTSKNRPRRAE